MTWTAALLAATLTGTIQTQLPTPAQQAQTQPVVTRRAAAMALVLASPVQLPDGRLLGTSVVATPGADPWFVYSRGTLCQSVISRTTPTDATEGWRVTVTERARTETHVTVGLTWWRMWERGRPVTHGSGGTNELTLQRGDRIGLDQITRPSEPGVCAATMKRLELRVGLTPMTAPSTDEEAVIDGTVDAELWMVHQAPDGKESVSRQVVRLTTGGIGFTFSGPVVETSDGAMVIELTGTLKAVKRADGTRALWAGLTRVVTQRDTGRLRSSGSAGKTEDWLAAGDVVSYNLPDAPVYAGQPGGGGGSGGAMRGGGSGGAMAGGGSGGGVVARGSGGAQAGGTTRTTVASGAIDRGPNLLEGHRLSLRVRLIETK